MENQPAKPKKRFSWFRILLYGFLGLFVIVFILPYLVLDNIGGGGGKIGVVEVTGVIMDSREVVRQLSKYRKDENILGIVLRIDSPGGSVAPSQEIYDEVLRVRKSGKKVYASMGALAASGGYYIASPADQIIANPGTLTGSIGVIMAFSNMEELMGKIGLRPEVIKSGEFKDTGSPLRTITQKERQYLQDVIDDVHSQFVEAVASGRKMDIQEVGKLANGKIYTGRQAKELKLVDRLGGLENAVELLARAVGIKGEPEVVQEQPSGSLLDWLLDGSVSREITRAVFPKRYPTIQYLWYPN